MTPEAVPCNSVGISGARIRHARRGLAVYLTVVTLCSGLIEWLILRAGDRIEKHGGLILLLMWTPAAASLVARIVVPEAKVDDVSFRVGGTRGVRALLAAWFLPLVVCGFAYGIAWTAGLAGFDMSLETAIRAHLGNQKMLAAMSPASRFGFYLGMALTIGTVVNCLAAAGEEIGWRGYMLTRLVDGQVPQPLLVSGIIWAAWHAPLIISGQ